MKTENGDKVFYKLRVATEGTFCTQTNARTGMQKTIVFNGISANSWLLPVGFSQKDTAKEKTKKVYQTKILSSTREKETEHATESHKSELNPVDTDQPRRPMTAKEFDILFQRVPTRPKSTGTVYVVRAPQTPVGLRKDTYIQGSHLRSKFEGDRSVPQFDSRRLHERPRPFTAPGRSRHSRADRLCLTPICRSPLKRGFRDGGDAAKPVNVDSSLDLVITSLEVSKVRIEDQSCGQGKELFQEHHLDTVSSRYPRTLPSTTNPSSQQVTGDGVLTLDGLQDAYLQRRAKSAPPKVSASLLVTGTGERPSGNEGGSGSGKRPSLYWKARSAYHKKLMVYGHDPETQEASELSSPAFRGSLWRPLMMQEEGEVLMQHSAGCPYKCKGCFKACLVSEDYLEKARARKLQQEGAASNRNSDAVRAPNKKRKDVNQLIFMALARSQPLYQMVHGAKSECKSKVSDGSEKEQGGETVPVNSCIEASGPTGREYKDVTGSREDKTDRDTAPFTTVEATSCVQTHVK